MTEQQEATSPRQNFMDAYEAWHFTVNNPYVDYDEREELWQKYVIAREIWTGCSSVPGFKMPKHAKYEA